VVGGAGCGWSVTGWRDFWGSILPALTLRFDAIPVGGVMVLWSLMWLDRPTLHCTSLVRNVRQKDLRCGETQCGSYLSCGWPLVATLAEAEGASLWEEKIFASKIPGWPSGGVGITASLVCPVGRDVVALAGFCRYRLCRKSCRLSRSSKLQRRGKGLESWEVGVERGGKGVVRCKVSRGELRFSGDLVVVEIFADFQKVDSCWWLRSHASR